MSGDYEEDHCRSAFTLVRELCSNAKSYEDKEKCLEFDDLMRNIGRPWPPDAGLCDASKDII